MHVNNLKVSKAIDSLNPNRTTDAFGISAELIKICTFELLELITLIINQSIISNTFPKSLKVARVAAVFKKGDNKYFDNYRPISILPAISKILERIFNEQISDYFNANNLLFSVNTVLENFILLKWQPWN